MDKKDRTDELFRAGLEEFEPETPHDIWPRLSERLEAKKRKKRIAYWRWASLAAALVLAFYSGYYFQLSQEQEIPEYLQGLPATNPQEESLKQVEEEPAEQASSPESDASVTEPPRSEKSKKPSRSGQKTNPDSKVSPAPAEGPIKILKQDWEQTTQPSRQYQVSNESSQSGDPATPLADAQITNSELANDAGSETALPVNSDEYLTSEKLQNSAPEVAKPNSQPTEYRDGVKVRKMETEAETTDIRSLALKTNDQLQNKEKHLQKGSLELALMAGPAISFRNVQVNDNQGFTSQNVNNEDLQNTYSGGLALAYRAGERWEIQSGLYLNQWEQANSAVMLQSDNAGAATGMEFLMANTSNGTLAFDSQRSSSNQTALVDGSGNSYVLLSDVEQSYRFIEVPLSLGYFLLDNDKWSWKLMAGVSSRFLNQSDVQLRRADGSSQQMDALRPNDFSLQLETGSGVGYKLNRKLQINLLPTLRYGLTPVSNNNAVNTYFHQFLLYSGLSYQF